MRSPRRRTMVSRCEERVGNVTETTAAVAVAEVTAELAALEDPKVLEVNRRHGDAHGVNLGQLRALGKRLGTQQDLARELWATGGASARLLAILICRPRAFDRDELDEMEAEMSDAPDPLQWAMNHCLAQIGIEHEEYRARAIDIGERLRVLEDYPTPPNCTSPFAPVWITEIVARRKSG